MAHDQGREGCARMMRRAFMPAAFCAALLVSACATDPGSVVVGEPNALPVNYRADILAYMRTYLNDPTGVREAYITEPLLRGVPGAEVGQGMGQRTIAVERYMVCIRFNAKNSIGRYEGTRDFIVAFLGGKLDTMAAARGGQCKDATWLPFSELEKLKR
jgi:hypothetical protein